MSEQHLPQGPWFGHFSYAFGGGRTPTQMLLEIEGESLAGQGRDADGRYSIDGAIAGDLVRWIKSYESGPAKGGRVAYVGTFDPHKREIEGRWRVVDTVVHGRFALMPGEPEDLVDEAEMKTLLASSSRFTCRLPLEPLRFDGEHAMLEALASDPGFVEAIRSAKAAESVGSAQIASNPLQALIPRHRLERTTMPAVFEALDRCRKVLGFDGPVELYVENNGQVNAWIEITGANTIAVTFTSAALDLFDIDELSAVLGHELGHALLGHIETRVGSDAALAGVTQLRRLALARYQELSADRVGLLCCGSLEKVLLAEFMLHTGVTRRDRIGTAEMLERAALESVARGEGKAPEGFGGYDTHPCGAFRTLAVAWFGRSAPFYALRGQGPPAGTMSEEELEARVESLVSVMNPSALDAHVGSEELDQLVALTAFSVAEADARLTKKETTAIRALSPGVSRALDEISKRPFEVRQLMVIDLAERLVVTLPPYQRERIVEDLTVIAQVDGHLSEQELSVLVSVSELLQVSPGVPSGVLGELSGGLD